MVNRGFNNLYQQLAAIDNKSVHIYTAAQDRIDNMLYMNDGNMGNL